MFGGDDDDQDFLSPSGGSKLASIFGIDKSASQGGNESLTYTAPKEPKKKDADSSSSTPAQVILSASAVFAYKYIEDKFVSQGKVGAAILANHSTKDYKLLLYITKEKPVTFAKLSSSFQFMIQPGNYATFYDESRHSWSVMFDDATSLQKFSTDIALLKALSSRLEGLVVQDLVLGEGTSLEAGDSVELRYSVKSLQGNEISTTVFDSNSGEDKLFRLKLGKGKSIKAWDEGIISMKKNGKRLVIAPPGYCTGGDGKAPKIPSNTNVVFELEIVRVKLGRDRSKDVTSAASDQAAVAQQPSAQQLAASAAEETAEEGVRAKSKSISEQLAGGVQSDKAKLISRMAKMGQPMLPVNPVPGAQESTELEGAAVNPGMMGGHRPDVPQKPSVHSQPMRTEEPVMGGAYQPSVPHHYPQYTEPHPFNPAGPSPSIPPHMQHSFNPGLSSTVSLYQPQQPYMYPPQPQVGYPYQSVQQYPPMFNAGGGATVPSVHQPPQPVQQPQSQDMTVMMVETRQQNTEIRVGLSKVTDKIDRMSEKIDMLSAQQSASLALTNNAPSMEISMLVHSIQRIVKENEQLKSDTIEKSTKIETLNNKIGELLQRNQQYIEQSNAMLELRNDSYKSTAVQSQERVQVLEQDKMRLINDLSLITSQLSSSQLELAAVKKKEKELLEQLEHLIGSESKHREELTTLRLQNSENLHNVDELTSQLKTEKQENKSLELQLTQLKENLSEITLEKDSLEKNLSERKKKSAEDCEKLEKEMSDMRASFEKELSDVKERLKSEKSSTELTTAQQVTEAEAAVENQWKEKCNRLLASAKSSHQREIEELMNEKQWLQEKVATLETKVAELKSSRLSDQQLQDQLSEEIEQLKIWKDKHAQLRAQAGSMKERYEQRLQELIEERDSSASEQERLKEMIRELRANAPSSASSAGASGASVVVPKVKSIMSSVFKQLKGEFDSEESYEGSHVQSVILNVIKRVTLEMLQDLEEQDNSVSNQKESSHHSPASQQKAEEIQQKSSAAESSPVHESSDQIKPQSSQHLLTSVKQEHNVQKTSADDVNSAEKVSQNERDDENTGESSTVSDEAVKSLEKESSQFSTEGLEKQNVSERLEETSTERLTLNEGKSDRSVGLVQQNENTSNNSIEGERNDFKSEDTEVSNAVIKKNSMNDGLDNERAEEEALENMVEKTSENEGSVIQTLGAEVGHEGIQNTDENQAESNKNNSSTEGLSSGVANPDVTTGDEVENENKNVVQNMETITNQLQDDDDNDMFNDDTVDSITPDHADSSDYKEKKEQEQENPESSLKSSAEGTKTSEKTAEHPNTEQFNEQLTTTITTTTTTMKETAESSSKEDDLQKLASTESDEVDMFGGDTREDDDVNKSTTLENKEKTNKVPQDKVDSEVPDDDNDNDDDDDSDLFQDAAADKTEKKENVTVKVDEEKNVPNIKPSASNPLFDDDDDEDLFGVVSQSSAKPAASLKVSSTGATAKDQTSKSNGPSSKKDQKTESDEETNNKPPPMPLFDESGDEDDLNWLS